MKIFINVIPAAQALLTSYYFILTASKQQVTEGDST